MADGVENVRVWRGSRGGARLRSGVAPLARVPGARRRMRRRGACSSASHAGTVESGALPHV